MQRAPLNPCDRTCNARRWVCHDRMRICTLIPGCSRPRTCLCCAAYGCDRTCNARRWVCHDRMRICTLIPGCSRPRTCLSFAACPSRPVQTGIKNGKAPPRKVAASPPITVIPARKVECPLNSEYVRFLAHCTARSNTPTALAAAFSLSSTVASGRPSRMANSR